MPDPKLSVGEDVAAVRGAAGAIAMSGRGKIRVTGRDRTAFLHSMLTNDVKKLKAGEGLYACLLDAKAHVLADANLFAFEDFFLLDCEPGLASKITGILGKYIIMEDVTLENAGEGQIWLGLEGPQAVPLTERILQEKVRGWKPFDHAAKTFWGIEAEVFRLSYTGRDGFYFLAEAPDGEILRRLLMDQGKAFGLRPCGEEALEVLRIEAGIPRYGADMDETILFPETGLGHAVSYEKGCYIGQEVVARLNAVAQVTKKLVGLKIAGDHVPERRAKIVKDGEATGYVTSAVWSPTLGAVIALGYVRRTRAEAGTALEVISRSDRLPASVASLPLVPLPALRRA